MLLPSLGRGLAKLRASLRPSRIIADVRERRRLDKMEVTVDNFSEKLPEVLAAVDGASFVAIDGEFTGISDNNRNCPFDTPSERYERLAESTRKFRLVQFGLCTFHYDKEKDSYSNQAFNFYVWPRPYARGAPDPKFLCQTSSLDFLVSQGFDFNKLVRKGISYLNPLDYRELRERLLQKFELRKIEQENAKNNERTKTFVPESERKRLEQIHSDIESSLLTKQKEEVRLPGLSPFQRKLVYETVGIKYKEVAVRKILEKENEVQKVTLSLGLRNTDENSRENSDRAELDALEEALGFTKVIRGLSRSGKLVVGHNMMLDLCHTLNSFVMPLPRSYVDFKSVVSSSFPHILDTKLMASTYPFRDEVPNSSLGELKHTVSVHPYEIPEVQEHKKDSGYSLKSPKYHEAGYDAFITGLCFIAMANRLGLLSQDKDSLHPRTGRPRILPDSPLVAPFTNKLHVMRMSDVPYMDLTGPDPDPPRDHVFHLTFPKEWRLPQIMDLFSPMGNVYVSFINDTTAYVSLHERDNASKVLSSLNWGGRVSVMPFAQFKALDGGGREAVSNAASSCGLTPMLENNLSFVTAFSTPPPSAKAAGASGDSLLSTPVQPRRHLQTAAHQQQQQQPQQQQQQQQHKRRLEEPSVAPLKRQKSVADGGGGCGDAAADTVPTGLGKKRVASAAAAAAAASASASAAEGGDDTDASAKKKAAEGKLFAEPEWD